MDPLTHGKKRLAYAYAHVKILILLGRGQVKFRRKPKGFGRFLSVIGCCESKICLRVEVNPFQARA